MREWIEISMSVSNISLSTVLPRMREWIEIRCRVHKSSACLGSPSYEGVDWNSSPYILPSVARCSPSYEGVDWNKLICQNLNIGLGSPSYEGVDWNIGIGHTFMYNTLFSLVWGSGLKYKPWICWKVAWSSPSYEGVDWNNVPILWQSYWKGSPSYEGVDWNDHLCEFDSYNIMFSLVWGSGLK